MIPIPFDNTKQDIAEEEEEEDEVYDGGVTDTAA